MSQYDSSHLLVVCRTIILSFPDDADSPTCWVSILVGKIVQCGIHVFLLLGEGHSARRRLLGSLRSPGFSRQVGWPSAGFARRLAK